MRYAAIIPNDVSNGEGICTSFFVQGCPHHCKGCFNPETWDFTGGKPFTDKTVLEILDAIGANDIQRNFCVLGGEPLAPENTDMTRHIVSAVRNTYPNIKIYLWTGYTFDQIKTYEIIPILKYIDVLIDGPFIEEEKDLSLHLRGSRNQHVYVKKNNHWELEE
ncbi:MAG: anaerobic ribonucleoside-triphosphate reductase activating protein [Alphaproteobacteria bacterium]|nr:anaerobic ribonucleoside-triphosphate reductase activating protein [Alphaproteobacteria bacterium]